MKASGQDRVQLRNAALQVSGHRCHLNLAVLDIQPPTFPLIADRLPSGGTAGLLAIPSLLRLPSLGRAPRLFVNALPVRTFAL
jgi:hypothetical protein